jgi:hypothetical protein
MSPQTSVANLRSPGNSPCRGFVLHQGKRPKLSNVRDAVEAGEKRHRNCNSGCGEATFESFLVITPSELSGRWLF